MTDLDAIRARDAVSEWGPEDARQACLDRSALLAEVDRLRGMCDEWERTSDGHLDGWLAERARIRAAVEGLPRYLTGTESLDRAAVLAAIDGETR